MLDEFDECPTIYVWPKGAEEGWSWPDDFWQRVTRALASEGLDWETV